MKVSQNIKDSLERYVEKKIPTGSFLEAVLCNNLYEACFRADHINRHAIFEIVSYVCNELPSQCWGSPEHVEEWLNK